MSTSYVESWRDPQVLGHRFRGLIDDRDLSMDPREVIERVKSELVSSIVSQIMNELGPAIDEAITSAWSDK